MDGYNKQPKKYARKCDVTGKGMNDGYCINDGEMYIKNKSEMLKHIKSVGYKTLDEAFNDEYYYWTEWEELDEDYHYLEDGTEIVTFLKQ